MFTRKRIALGSVLAVGATAVAAASLGGNASAASAAKCAHPKKTTVKVDMFEMGFQLKPAAVPCGKVTFKEKNTGAISHNFHIEGFKPGKLIPAGGTSTQVLTVKPGKLSYVCDVLGHAQAGMSGSLKVKR